MRSDTIATIPSPHMHPARAILVLFIVAPFVHACGNAEEDCDDGAEDDCGGCCDVFEPSDHACHAPSLGNFTDSPDTSSAVPGLTIGAGEGDDVDWYSFHVTDELDLGGSPWITVRLTGAAAGTTVAGWFRCDEGSERHTCTVGIVDTSEGEGCRALDASTGFRLDPDCSSTADDDGVMLVRVLSASSATCEPYQLDIAVQ